VLRQGDHAPLLFVLAILFAAMLATSSASARRRMRRRGAFAGGLLGLGALVLWWPHETRRVVTQFASKLPSLPSISGEVSPREVTTTPIRFTDVNCAERGTLLGDRASEAMRRMASGRAVRCSLIGKRSYTNRRIE